MTGNSEAGKNWEENKDFDFRYSKSKILNHYPTQRCPVPPLHSYQEFRKDSKANNPQSINEAYCLPFNLTLQKIF